MTSIPPKKLSTAPSPPARRARGPSSSRSWTRWSSPSPRAEPMTGHLVYGFTVSVDGYIARGQGGDIGLPVPEEALFRYFNEMQKRTALSLYGRNMYEVMKYWDAPPAESSAFEQEFARAWQATPKVVFSTTLESVGPNARLVKDKADVERTVRQLKAETNGQIEVAGT